MQSVKAVPAGDLAETILAVLGGLLEGRDAGAVRRLISTTLVTNLLATQKGAGPR